MTLGTINRAPLALLITLLCMGFVAESFAQAVPPATQSADTAAVDATIREQLTLLGSRSTGLEAVRKMKALDSDHVLRVFKYIQDNRLYKWNGQIILRITTPEGDKVYDVFTALDPEGIPESQPIATVPAGQIAEADVIDVAKPVRTEIINSLLVIGLKLKDPAIRLAAARDIGNKRFAPGLNDLKAVATNDPDAKVRRAATESIYLIQAGGDDPSITPEERAQAVRMLGEMQSLNALGMLKEQAAKPEAAALAPAYKKSIEQIQRHLTITDWIKNLFFGLSAGSIFVLLALGLAVTFGLMGVINMAHGEMLMIGAVTTWACHEFISPFLPAAYFDWYYVIAFPLSFLAAAGVGLLIEVSVVRYLYKRPLDSLLATIGISFILTQAVRLWKGDNLGMRKPSWANGSWEIFQDVSLAYNRLFLIVLCAFCVVSVIVLFRYTKIGLMIRATVQNREMAQALGVNTRLVDMFTFAFGAGLAGLAGYGIVLTTSPSPGMGETYIVKTFLTVVIGGVGKLAGVVVSGLGLGFVEKLLEPIVIIEHPIRIFDSVWSQVAALLMIILFMQRKPAGLFPDKGRMADQADTTSATNLKQTSPRTDLLLGGLLALVGLVVIPALYGNGVVSADFVNKLGYILAFAICAIGLDLIWGYIGVLSLCQFLFFALGGYCMGLYLINHGPMTKGIPACLDYVMSDPNGGTPPWFLPMFDSFPAAIALGLLLPGLLALLIGVTTFRSRVRGVYFSILTQAITVACALVFQKNELKLGGTNGLTKFTQILGYSIQGNENAGPFHQTRFWLYIASVVALLAALFLAKALVTSGFGRVLVAIRDDETRLRFVGYQTWAYKAAAFGLAAVFGAVGGMLWVPQKGIITPGEMKPFMSILVVAWVAVGGRGSLWGAVLGTIVVSLTYDKMTSWKPDYWLFVLGGLFVLIPVLAPGGLMSIPQMIRTRFATRSAGAAGFGVATGPAQAGGH
jgi:urea transport system permease protein